LLAVNFKLESANEQEPEREPNCHFFCPVWTRTIGTFVPLPSCSDSIQQSPKHYSHTSWLWLVTGIVLYVIAGISICISLALVDESIPDGLGLVIVGVALGAVSVWMVSNWNL
jgi:hypothetical protein